MRLFEMMLAWDWREVLVFFFLVSFMDLNTYCLIVFGCLGLGMGLVGGDGRALTRAEEGRFDLDLRSASLVSV